MIQIEREKLEKVLDALENDTYPEAKYGINTAIAIIKDVLAQPEQEPVKYSDYEPDGVHHNKPPQRTWVGLTDEEYAELAEEFGPFPINQIEAKLKEKNT